MAYPSSPRPHPVPLDSNNGALPVSLVWSWTPVTQGASMHYQMDVDGSLSPAAICAQNAIMGQPDNTCVVAFTGTTTCYT